MPELESRVYQKRLQNEYTEVMKLNHAGNKLFTISAAPGEDEPFVSEYILTYHGETWVTSKGAPVRRRSLEMSISLFRDFPHSSPHTEIISGGVPYHTNWWAEGYICNGSAWTINSHVDEYIRFVIEVLQFKPERINPNSAANHDAKDWWLSHQNDHRYFPTDNTSWPGKRIVAKIKFV